MSQNLSADQELVSDVVACQLVIKQILDVLDVIAPVEVREKMSTQLKNIDFASHPAAADPVTLRAIQKAIALIELRACQPPRAGADRGFNAPGGAAIDKLRGGDEAERAGQGQLLQ